MIQPYAPIDRLPTYQAGRSAELVAAEHGLEEAIKLASNESPFGPLPSVAAAIETAAASVNRYPHVSAGPLREALAELHGGTAEEIVVGGGSSGVLWQLAAAYVAPGDEIVMHVPAFEAYPIIATLSQAVAVQVPLTDWTTDVERLHDAVTARTKVVFLTDPHNPTGTSVAPDAIRWLAERLDGRCLLVVDQAYHEFLPADRPQLGGLFQEFPDVVLLRTFSKAYGLAALRVGYAGASLPVAAALRRVAAPFAVSSISLVAAGASLRAQAELAERVAFVNAERCRLADGLRATGVAVPESHANFVFAPVAGQVDEVVAALERRGTVTRGVGNDGIRITVGLPPETDRLLEAWTAAVGAA